MKPKLLLHSCCAPCSIYVIEKLAQQFKITVFFYDPNVHPRKEYILRRDEMKNYAKKIGLDFEEGDYQTKDWFDKAQGLESEPEKGRRCEMCFDLRLSKTAVKARVEEYDAFATVLSISPHKDYQQISVIGNKLAHQFGINFLDRDWKKKNGFKIATKMSKEQNFYRQDYCGCIYSKKQQKVI
ncbi:MAG: epoxyqueuosine reductase QueH [bacterium]|nr:epoxyqueuosine reductase QueH [bacterium]